MSKELYIVADMGVLKPYSSADADRISQMKAGEPYKVCPSRPRNVKFHRKFFLLLSLVYDSLPDGFRLMTPAGQSISVNSVDDLLWHIKMQLGYYTQRVTLGGKITYEAKSISFAAMDDDQFSVFFDRAIEVVIKYFLVGADRDEIIEIINANF